MSTEPFAHNLWGRAALVALDPDDPDLNYPESQALALLAIAEEMAGIRVAMERNNELHLRVHSLESRLAALAERMSKA